MFYVLLRGSAMAYNVADPNGLVSIRELATLFTQVRPDRGLRLIFTNASDERAYSQAKRQGLRSERLMGLGWQALVDLPTGLDRMVSSFEDAVRDRTGS